MIYIIATTYVTESASYAFWKSGLLTYTLSNHKVKHNKLTTQVINLFYFIMSRYHLCTKPQRITVLHSLCRKYIYYRKRPFLESILTAELLVLTQELCKKYPNKKVMFSIAASDYPRLNITEGYAAMFAEASLSMYVDNDGTEELAFVLAMVREQIFHSGLAHFNALSVCVELCS